jgi:hypothetical protein
MTTTGHDNQPSFSESTMPLRLVSSEAFTTGVLHLIYPPAESTPFGTYEEAKRT